MAEETVLVAEETTVVEVVVETAKVAAAKEVVG